jgi:outer membrane protein, heavy metal efflux system
MFSVLRATAPRRWVARGLSRGLFLWGLLVCALPVGAQAGLGHDAAVALALQRSAMLQSRSAALDGADLAAASANQLPDPKLSLGLDNLPINSADRFSLTRDFMTQRQIGWSQDMPNATKRLARAEGAAARSAREAALLKAERVVVAREASLAWLARFYAERRLLALAALDSPNELLRGTVNARIAAGKATPADAVMAQQEALALADRRDEVARDVAKARAALRRWVGDDADLGLTGEPPPPTGHDDTHLRFDAHPELATYGAMADMARAEAQEIDASKQGDWSWAVGYAKRGPAYSDMVSVQLSFELPLWSRQRQDPQIAARRKEIERFDAEREDKRRSIVSEVEALRADAAELAAKIARLQHQGLPLAEERAALTLASYQAGRSDLASVIAARKDTIETQLRLIDLSAAKAQVHALLDSHRVKEQP